MMEFSMRRQVLPELASGMGSYRYQKTRCRQSKSNRAKALSHYFAALKQAHLL
jgi:hypothetical protein